MPSIYFISDLHISDAPSAYPAVTDFFEKIRLEAEAIYILGDLFEAWWGDDHNYPPYKLWEEFFQKYTVPLYFLVGNRDFLCGKDFYNRAGISAISSGHIIKYAGHTVGVLHGDEPGLQDPPYQRLRSFIRTAFFRTVFLIFPRAFRQYISCRARAHRVNNPSHYDLKIDMDQWLLLFSERPSLLINGHLHQPLIEKYQEITRYQLGSWDNQATSYIEIKSDGAVLLV